MEERLPMTRIAATSERPVSTPGELRPRVLIVDDDEIVRMLLQDICAEYGWDVVVAATRDDAILAAGLQHIDLVLLDWQLRDRDSDPLDTLSALRAICPTTPIVVVTGQSPEALAPSVALAGGQSVVGKPCSVVEFAALLKRYRPAVAGVAASR